MIILRPYQEEAVQTVLDAMQKDRFILLQAATGAGKTVIFSELCKRILTGFPGMRILILAHRRELIQQNADKLLRVWPEAPLGVACASVDARNVNVDAPVVVGSIQTVVNRLNIAAPFHLVIVDEVHRLPSRNKDSGYKKLIERMESYFQDVRVLGVTATPYRLGMGYICGGLCKDGMVPWFDRCHYKIGIQTLQDLGFLCGIRAKAIDRGISLALAGIGKSGGDFNLDELSDVMSSEVHVGSAVKAVEQHAADRSRIVVFCVSITHAETVMLAFNTAGYTCECVHSEMSLADRDAVLRDYRDGKIRVLTNVGVLTEGWDDPATDCVLMCRPTLSPALYVQQIGRALRIHPGKEDMLILDLSGNIERHGDPDDPHVLIPGKPQKQTKAPTKTCPKCDSVVHASCKECQDCGYEWPKEINEVNEAMELVDVSWQKPDKIYLDVQDVKPFDFISKNGNRMLKVSVMGNRGFAFPVTLNDFWDFEGNGSDYGRRKARTRWLQLGGDHPLPDTVEEALERFDELTFPDEIRVQEDGKYLKIVEW